MTLVDVHLAQLAQSVDLTELGQRVRALRVAAGLTQSDVAGRDVTAAYVSRIEAGQRRPTTQVLEMLAERLSTTLDYLLQGPATSVGAAVQGDLEDQVWLDHAELLLASGDAAGASAKLDAVLPSLQEAGRPWSLRRARHLRAGALEALGDTTEAIRLLESLASEAVPDVQWIRSVIALSRCYRETGELGRAIAAGERAVGHLAELGLADTTEAVQLTVTIAGAYMERGDLEHALRLCLDGVEQGERIASPIGQGSAYWNASVVESMRGNAWPALQLAERAMAYLQVGDDSRNLGRLRTQVAILQLRLDPPQPEAARDTLSQAERELSWAATSPFDRARHHLASAKARILLDALDDAEHHVEQAQAHLLDTSPILAAESHMLRGEIEAARGRDAAARESYQRAAHELVGVGAEREVTRLWFELAAVLEASGDAAGALDAYKRGAASTGLADPARHARTLTS